MGSPPLPICGLGVGLAAEAVKASGQRAMLAHNIKDFGDHERGERELKLAMDVWKQWNGYADGRIQVGLGPHSVYTCMPDLLKACAEQSSSHSIHLQIHGCETKQEVAECEANYGMTPIQLMADVGLLGSQTIVAHAVHMDTSDIAIIKSSGAAVAHNIASNLKLASGIAPVQEFIEEGICVGIGTDGPGSNDGLDLLSDLKYVSLIPKAVRHDATSMPADVVLAMATRSGAEALGMEKTVGSLEPEKAADIITIDFDKPQFTPCHFDNFSNVQSLLVTVATGQSVDTVIVGGNVLVERGQPIFLNSREIQAHAQESARRLL